MLARLPEADTAFHSWTSSSPVMTAEKAATLFAWLTDHAFFLQWSAIFSITAARPEAVEAFTRSSTFSNRSRMSSAERTISYFAMNSLKAIAASVPTKPWATG